jgi:hypothetical protein
MGTWERGGIREKVVLDEGIPLGDIFRNGF